MLSYSGGRSHTRRVPTRCDLVSSCANSYVNLTVLFILVIVSIPVQVQGIDCATDLECVANLRVGSICDPDTLTCTNPFMSGCLQNMLGEEEASKYMASAKRICNSDDQNDATDCTQQDPRLNYLEIRIAPGNWESTMFFAWLMQILLSEFLGVPSTIETSGAGPLSFYDKDNTLSYPGPTYPFEALEAANKFAGNCTSSPDDVACAHVLPELWDGETTIIREAQRKGTIEPTQGCGYYGKIGWYIPIFLAEKNPAIISYFGFAGEENRQLLAETFKRPLTWQEYCDRVGSLGCNESDPVAKQQPSDTIEGSRYFVSNIYQGYFDDQHSKNDCVANPTTCTGHMVVGGCGEVFYFFFLFQISPPSCNFISLL